MKFFYKYHSLGNDFIIIEWDALRGDLNDCSLYGALAPWIAWLCDRHTGVGADGVLFISLHDNNYHTFVFNADGSYGEFSGNGIRCVAWFLMRHKNVVSPLVIFMNNKSVELRLDSKGQDEAFITTSVANSYYQKTVDLEVADQKFVGHVVVGANPHLIIEHEIRDLQWLEVHGKALEHYAADGSRINVEFIWPAASNSYEMRVFERGVGITQACSSGVIACHSWLTHTQKVLLGEKISWSNLGGTVVAVSKSNALEITAPATFVYEARLSPMAFFG